MSDPFKEAVLKVFQEIELKLDLLEDNRCTASFLGTYELKNRLKDLQEIMNKEEE